MQYILYLSNIYIILITFHFNKISFHRANNNWQTNFASINKSNENSPQTSKKQRDCGESARDSLAYSCLLKNELLGTAIEDVKAVSDERNENTYTPAAKRSLFKYQSPTKQVSSMSPTSVWAERHDNELISNPYKHIKHI